MSSITDYITIAAFLYFFFSGWRKGFLKTLLGPLSLVVGCLAGFAYYQKTQNMAIGLGISILGPFVFNILASILLKIWHRKVNDSAPPSKTSQMSGGTLSLLWGGSYLILIIVMIAIAPFNFKWFKKAQNDVLASKTYALVQQQAGDRFPNTILDIKQVTSILEDPKKLKQFQSTEEFKSLSEDKSLKDLLTDEETADQIKNKDYSALLANPKMQNVFQNKELLKKIFDLNKKIAEGVPEETSGAKIIDLQPK